MEADLNRFTISLTPDMEAELRMVRRTYFGKENQNDMLKELIRRGVQVVAADGGIKEVKGHDNNFREG